jgi:branched-chain amino acid transport system ATP-binding protein
MALLEARNVTLRYGSLVAVDDVSVDVDAGSIVGLIGPNGAGKTSMLDAVSGFARSDAGRIILGGRNVAGWHPERRAAEGMARTFQRLELFRNMTVFENLLVAAEARFAEVEFVADLAGRSKRGRAHALALDVLEWIGLEGVADRVAGEVPLGQGRLVEIGRALCTDPKLILLDEPASGLDDSETGRLAEILSVLAREDGLAILLVEHDLAMVMKLCDRIAVMDFGAIIAEGAPQEIREHPAVQAAYLGEEVSVAGASRG